MVMVTAIVVMLIYNQLVDALDYTKYLCRYQYHYTSMTWASAREVCESTNRTLLKIDSSAELTNISSVIMPHVRSIRPDLISISDILWIGLHQETEPIRLVWNDCEEYTVSAGDWTTVPGTTGGCAVYNTTNNQYSMYNCSDTQPFICEDTSESVADCYIVLSVDSPDIPPQIGSDSSFDGSSSLDLCANLCYTDQMCAAFQLKDVGGSFECYRHYYDETGLAITRTPNVINIKNIFVLNDPIPSNTPQISDYTCPVESTTIQPTTTSTDDSISSVITTTIIYSSSSSSPITLSSSSGIITSSYVVSGTTTSECLCPCTLSLASSSITNEELQAKIEQIQSELSLDKKDMSSYKRKLISAPDDRVSAQSIGYVGVVILTIVIGLLVGIDIPTLAKDTKAFFQRCGNICKKS